MEGDGDIFDVWFLNERGQFDPTLKPDYRVRGADAEVAALKACRLWDEWDDEEEAVMAIMDRYGNYHHAIVVRPDPVVQMCKQVPLTQLTTPW